MTEPHRPSTTVTTPNERAEAEAAIERAADAAVAGSEPTEPGRAAVVEDTATDVEVTSDPRVPARVDDAIAPGDSSNGDAAGEVEVECPGCGLILVGQAPRPTAAWFCPRCDYPVFWASPPAPETIAQPRARRRLPGTGGAQVLGATPCWSCGELNEPDRRGCVRCDATLPRPTDEAAETRIVTVTRGIEIPEPVRLVLWPYLSAAVLAGAAIASTVTRWLLLANGGG